MQSLNGVYHITNENTITEMTNKSFNNNVIVFIKFSAKWCGPCKKIQPFYEHLADIYKNAIFTCIDTDQVENVTSTYNITSLPTFAVIKNGNYQELMKGCDSKKLQNLVQQYV
jgi:thioredoxin 1